MKVLESVAGRVARSDMLQALTLLFAVLVVVVSVGWPSGGTTANESWFSLASVRNALLALAAAGFGAAQGVAARRRVPAAQGATTTLVASDPAWRYEARLTLGALFAWVFLTLPFESATQAASYPAVEPWWSLLIACLTVPGYFGLGLLLRRLTAILRVGWALPLLVPASLLLFGWIDLRLELTLLNPWAAPLAPSWTYVVTLSAAALLTLLALALPARSATRTAAT